MRMWQTFWLACFLLAGMSFVFVAAVVLVLGVKDLRDMIGILEREKRAQKEADSKAR